MLTYRRYSICVMIMAVSPLFHAINLILEGNRYDSRFVIPVFDAHGEVIRYNVFFVEMLIRHAEDGKLYLYDVVNIKKETGNPLEQMLYGNKPIS